MNDRPEDRVGKCIAGGREIDIIERPLALPVGDEEMKARCAQCISQGAHLSVGSEFIIHYAKFPDANDTDQSVTYRIACDGLRDKPGLCAIKAVQYTSRESGEILSETYLDEEYERKLLERSRESKIRGLVRRLFGNKTT